MAGKIKALIDLIVEKRSQGNPTLAVTTKTKIMLKGINPEIYNNTSEDNAAIEQRVKDIGKELGITI
ncbi:MAG TPA: hypothetical protein VHO70_06640 [Chitinispirillaceae bacterium]|nr:hypothetical protein [Chitinispirillaceae bacterium]